MAGGEAVFDGLAGGRAEARGERGVLQQTENRAGETVAGNQQAVPELNLHATEELNHAVLLSNRIIQLGGAPVLTPQDWSAVSPCKYDAPEDPYVAVLLDQNIAGEQCAITTYNGLMEATKDKDMVTYNMALTILQQEVEHEEDLQSLREDLDLMVQRGSK